MAYSEQSPYSKTPVFGDFLGIMNSRSVIHDPSDQPYTIESKYNMRPDLLAFNLYGSSKYWWLFAIRNREMLIDPIQDFRAGVTIRIPKLKNLR